MKCNNSGSGGIGGIPTCFYNDAVFQVTVYYFNSYETDKFYLCKECKDRLVKDCKKYGHKVTIQTIA